jgi:3-oxoacyl-[acyl-carrier protein] reductase
LNAKGLATVATTARRTIEADISGRGADNWQAAEEAFAAKAMMGRIGEPADIANAAAYLASPESGWITAQMLVVDGGRMDYIGHA